MQNGYLIFYVLILANATCVLQPDQIIDLFRKANSTNQGCKITIDESILNATQFNKT